MGHEYKCLQEVRGEIRFLTDVLAAMHAFLLVMSEEEDPNLQDKVWMTAVRELSYDMEDSIDDFMLSVDDKPHGFIEKMKHLLGKLGKMKAHRQIGNDIKDLKKKVIEVGERNQRYKTGVAISSTKNAAVNPRALVIFENASNLVGIDEPKAEIIKLLIEEDLRPRTQQQQPKIVSIVGSGGMGKTTLANQVYQHLNGQFECKAFLSVSRNPDMMNILRTILSQVSNQCYGNTEEGSIQQLIVNINQFLLDKRFFVVLDDIWEVDTWDVIKLAFPMISLGSIIITTTRITGVAESCRSSFGGDIYGIRHLNVVHSRELFHRRIFESNEECPSHLAKVSDEILKKCDGLPMAIVAISRLLANKERTEDLWNQVKDSIGRALERNHGVERMMKILSLSYFDLHACLKSCLLYMSIFREDTIIESKCLIRRWVGEGFIQKEGRYTVHDIGKMCFNELLNRGLIQPWNTDRYGKVKSCRVHDIILDFIIAKSIEENFVTLLGVPNLTTETQMKVVRRLSLHGHGQGNSVIPTTGLMLSHVRSLNVFRYSGEIPSLEELGHLRVLDLEDCSHLQEHHLGNIVRLFQLRYLNLKNTEIHEIPKQIGCLGCLEMLDLSQTQVRELPASIVNLRKLSHLIVDCNVKFSDGIAKMQALETLKVVEVLLQTFDFLCGLGQLKNLRNLCLIPEAEVIEGRNKAIISSLCKLGTQNLRSLTIWHGSSFLQETLFMLTLKKITTHFSNLLGVPKWVSSLKNLQQIHLQVKGLNQDDLCVLGAIPALLILHLEEVIRSKGRLRISGEIGFQFLKDFYYDASYRQVDLMFAPGSMPNLEKLELNCLHVVEAECLDFGIGNLPCLITVICVLSGEVGIVRAIKTATEKAARTHPNHPALLYEGVDSQGCPMSY